MTPDWSRITLEDVRRACQMYESGAARPKRPEKDTFRLLNGKTYPARFIRGRLPSRDRCRTEPTATARHVVITLRTWACLARTQDRRMRIDVGVTSTVKSCNAALGVRRANTPGQPSLWRNLQPAWSCRAGVLPSIRHTVRGRGDGTRKAANW